MEIELIRSRRRTIGIEIRGTKVIVRAPRYASREEIDRFVDRNRRWIETHLQKAEERERLKETVHRLTPEEIRELADRARKIVPERVKYYAPIIGVTYGRITIRRQRSRWGSCSTKGNLNFNCLLMLAPPEVLDSVVVHELCHRKYMDHSPRFYAEVLRILPDYREHYGWLKEHGEELMARLGEADPPARSRS